ncbi:MAG: response regulator [Polyangiaceae bacterium]
MSGAQSDAISLLVVDDDDVLRTQLVRAFADRGFMASGAANAREALELAAREAPELAVVDLRIGAESGLELLPRLLEIEPAMRIVVLTGYGSIATAVQATKIGATNYLAKPADVDDILHALEPNSSGSAANGEVPSLARAEWEHINRVLSDCGGNISEAARKLRIHRRSLQRKLNKFAPK